MVVVWPSGPVSVICPAPSHAIGVRDLRLRLLAGEPAEVRAADADAGQDPAVVLLAPCVQGTGADADGEQDAQDERDAEAEGERPSAPRPCRGLAVGHGGREGQDRHGIDAGLDGACHVSEAWHRRLGAAATAWWSHRRRERRRSAIGVVAASRRTSAASSGSPAGVSPSGVEELAARSAAELGRSVIRCSCAVGRRRASSLAAATFSRVHANLSLRRSARPAGLGRGTPLRRCAAGPPRADSAPRRWTASPRRGSAVMRRRSCEPRNLCPKGPCRAVDKHGHFPAGLLARSVPMIGRMSGPSRDDRIHQSPAPPCRVAGLWRDADGGRT